MRQLSASAILFSSHVDNFAQFAAIRLTLMTLGDSMMGYMVVNVVIAQWFVRQRGRALAFSSMGVGFAKVCMPVVAAWLMLSLGWRQTWLVFGLLTMALLVLPALLSSGARPRAWGFARRRGLSCRRTTIRNRRLRMPRILMRKIRRVWTRAEAMRTTAFWLLVITFGISSIGVTGLNLHVYPTSPISAIRP